MGTQQGAYEHGGGPHSAPRPTGHTDELISTARTPTLERTQTQDAHVLAPTAGRAHTRQHEHKQQRP